VQSNGKDGFFPLFNKIPHFCLQGRPQLAYEDTNNWTYYFHWNTSEVCSEKLSGGWIFLIMYKPTTHKKQTTKSLLTHLLFFCSLICLATAYLIGGMIFMKFARKASGTDIIPNKQFWLGFPGLIKVRGISQNRFSQIFPCRMECFSFFERRVRHIKRCNLRKEKNPKQMIQSNIPKYIFLSFFFQRI
jgi:hypothetical protein